jgi:hypothetical protein
VAAVFILRSQPLARAEAEAIEHVLSEAGEPEAGAVSLVETDEDARSVAGRGLLRRGPLAGFLARLGLDPAD